MLAGKTSTAVLRQLVREQRETNRLLRQIAADAKGARDQSRVSAERFFAALDLLMTRKEISRRGGYVSSLRISASAEH